MDRASRPLVIGHRGSPGYRPEHSLASYELAIEQGADAIEPDVVVSKDGVLVVRHENEISSTTDVAEHPEFADRKREKVVDGQRLHGWFTEDFTWEELSTLRCRERLPKLRPDNTRFDGMYPLLRLRDVLDFAMNVERDVTVVIELKHAAYFNSLGFDLAELLARDLELTGWSEKANRLVVESFELGVLQRFALCGVQAMRVFLMESEGAPADELAANPKTATSYETYRTDAQLALLARQVHAISVAKKELFRRDRLGRTIGTSNLVERAHAAGLKVFAWTLRPENRFVNLRFHSSARPSQWGDWQSEFDLALSTGVDGVFVDHVDLGVRAVQRTVSGRASRLDKT